MVNEKLQQDILDETAPPEFRENLLHQTIRTARGRRTKNQVGGGVALLALIAAAIMRVQSLNQAGAELAIVTKAAVPQPFKPAPHQTIQSRRFANILQNDAWGTVKILTSRKDSVAVFHSTPAFLNGVTQLNDEELLEMLKGKAVALVELPNGSEEIIFLEEAASSTTEAAEMQDQN